MDRFNYRAYKTKSCITSSLEVQKDSGVLFVPARWSVWRICLVASLGGLLFGFDTAVISGVIEPVRVQYALSAIMEGWFASAALVGCIGGAGIAGIVADRIGRRPVLILAGAFFLLAGVGCAFPPDFSLLVLMRFVCGFGIGLASVVAPVYISEFAPTQSRGRLGGLYQLFIVMGILLAYLSNWSILRFAQTHPAAFGSGSLLRWILVSEYWRGMFGAEVIPAILFLLLLLFVPETPRWLIKVGRRQEGLKILGQVSLSERTAHELEQMNEGKKDRAVVRELFRPGLRKALLVGVMLSVFGQLSGVNIVVYYGPKILMAAGFHDAGALLGQVGFGLINLIFTLFALTVIDRWGRRPLLLVGMGAVSFTMALTGFLFLRAGVINATFVAKGSEIPRSVGVWIGIMLCIYMACIALSICAVIWVVTPEIFPTRVRGFAVSIATFANWATNSLSALFFPWYVARFGMHSFFFTTAGICICATVFFWRALPETKGRSLEEIEALWR